MVKMSLIVAVAENGVIGADGDMPWKLSTDLKRFKSLTMGKPMVMGRKTFESIGKPLPGRTMIVVTRDRQWQSPGVVVVNSVSDAIAVAEKIASAEGQNEICVIGGGEIYRQTMPTADVLHYTIVHAAPVGDTKFPDIDRDQWKEEMREEIPYGERDSAATTYVVYSRIDSGRDNPSKP